MRSVHRALDDLADGMRSLLGLGESRPALVDELLGGRRRRPPARSAGLRGRAARRSHAPGRHLVRVK